MESDIKCLECGKITRNFELGDILYRVDNPSEILIKDAIVCPKCSKEISNEKCALKANYVLMKFVTANICRSMREAVPVHLKGAYHFSKNEFEKARKFCKSKPLLVDKF